MVVHGGEQGDEITVTDPGGATASGDCPSNPATGADPGRPTLSPTHLRRLLAATLLVVAGVGTPASAQTVEIDNLQTFQTPGTPVDVVVGPDAKMWVLDDQGSLSRLSGGKIKRITPKSGNDLEIGRQMTIDAWGRFVFITRNRSNRYIVRRVRPDGRYTDVRVPVHRQSPDLQGDIIAAPGGGVWFSWLTSARMSRLMPNGRLKEFLTPADYPGGLGSEMDIGPDGNIWAPTLQGVGRFTPKGQFLPPIQIVTEDEFARVTRVARGSDDAIYAGVDLPSYMARIDPADLSIIKHTLIPEPEGGGSVLDELHYWAMAPGPGALIWPISGLLNETAITEIISDSMDPIGPTGRLVPDHFLFLPDMSTVNKNLDGVSREHFGLAAGLDGRMWFTERLTKKLRAWKSPWSTASPRGRGRVLRTRRVGRWLRVELACKGTTGGYCVGTLRLRADGRGVGRHLRYAVAAGPAAVQSRSARWLRVPNDVRSARVTVAHRRVG